MDNIPSTQNLNVNERTVKFKQNKTINEEHGTRCTHDISQYFFAQHRLSKSGFLLTSFTDITGWANSNEGISRMSKTRPQRINASMHLAQTCSPTHNANITLLELSQDSSKQTKLRKKETGHKKAV